MKEAYAVLLSFLVEAARHDTDPSVLTSSLEEFHFEPSRTEKVVKFYQQHKPRLQATLSAVGVHPPHIIDASWRQEYCIKVCHVGHSMCIHRNSFALP